MKDSQTFKNGYHNFECVEQSLKLINEVVQGEKQNELLYDFLINIAPTHEEKEIFESMKNSKTKHYETLRGIYKYYKYMENETVDEVDFQEPKNYIDGIVRVLFEGLKTVEQYRDIKRGIPNYYHKEMIFQIITDELNQYSKYNSIYTENPAICNCCCNEGECGGGYTIDEWEKRITPLLDKAIHESTEIILSSILVGTGCTPEEAIEKVEEWEESQGE